MRIQLMFAPRAQAGISASSMPEYRGNVAARHAPHTGAEHRWRPAPDQFNIFKGAERVARSSQALPPCNRRRSSAITSVAAISPDKRNADSSRGQCREAARVYAGSAKGPIGRHFGNRRHRRVAP